MVIFKARDDKKRAKKDLVQAQAKYKEAKDNLNKHRQTILAVFDSSEDMNDNTSQWNNSVKESAN